MLDVAFEDVRFAIEEWGEHADRGWAHHVDHDRFVDDRARKRALVADGWTVIEVTWADLQARPDEVLDQIRRTLARLGG